MHYIASSDLKMSVMDVSFDQSKTPVFRFRNGIFELVKPKDVYYGILLYI